MHTYVIMKNPGYTRVSFQDWQKLVVAELTLIGFTEPVQNIRFEEMGGVEYILFDHKEAAQPDEIFLLSRLSFAYAIYEKVGEMLRPIQLDARYAFNQEISSILKYSGKTNELFTRLMLNLMMRYARHDTSFNVLDPMAGKGTTLYEALMQGYNAYGIEIDAKMPHESVVYLQKYLESAKHKHSNHAEKISGTSEFGKFTSLRSQISLPSQAFEIINGDARNAALFYKKNMFRGIVCDLPYGVHHGSKQNTKKPKNAGMTRNALGLVSESLPGWIKVLQPGGVIVLAWNLFLISREQMIELLTQNGLRVPENISNINFAHKVDQAIDRDLVVGLK